MKKQKTLWISAGETSGDMHGAELLRALRDCSANYHFVGMGGPALRAAGLEALFSTEDLSVMGITEVAMHLPKIIAMLKRMKLEMQKVKPDAIIVIDAPDFHFRVINIAKTLGIPVYYYISPKIWAWRQGRAHFIQQNVRRVFSILPFEVPFYQKFGMQVDYIGNPLVDIVDYQSIKDISPVPGRIGIFPGSRVREISGLLPVFSKTADLLHRHHPEMEFCCVRAPAISSELIEKNWLSDVPLQIINPENRWAFMRSCSALLAASGTVTLESAIAGVPTIATYKVSPLSFAVGKMVVKVPFVSLPNLILEKEVFPELLQKDCNPEAIALILVRWLFTDQGSNQLKAIQDDLAELRKRLGNPGAASRAAAIINQDLTA